MDTPSHGEILRAIGHLEGKLERLIDAAEQDIEQRASLGKRIGALEVRMGQVVVLAALTTMIWPVIWSEIRGVFINNHHTQQERIR